MLPVSGAMQLKAREPIGLRPMISLSGAYSATFSPLPYCSSGMKRFHRPAALAFLRTSLSISGSVCSLPWTFISSSTRFSIG